ncbi:hypothetical protein, partial [Saccharospirillum sp.]|uniref:hypothetical protein n=1 Tax=Saccharospirillum sp. TaxID=2033801 RepID=UPI0034A09D7F
QVVGNQQMICLCSFKVDHPSAFASKFQIQDHFPACRFVRVSLWCGVSVLRPKLHECASVLIAVEPGETCVFYSPVGDAVNYFMLLFLEGQLF